MAQRQGRGINLTANLEPERFGEPATVAFRNESKDAVAELVARFAGSDVDRENMPDVDMHLDRDRLAMTDNASIDLRNVRFGGRIDADSPDPTEVALLQIEPFAPDRLGCRARGRVEERKTID